MALAAGAVASRWRALPALAMQRAITVASTVAIAVAIALLLVLWQPCAVG